MRRDKLYLLDITEACKKISRFIAGKTFVEFSQDDILFDATVRNLQNIGEAVRCIRKTLEPFAPTLNGPESSGCGTF